MINILTIKKPAKYVKRIWKTAGVEDPDLEVAQEKESTGRSHAALTTDMDLVIEIDVIEGMTEVVQTIGTLVEAAIMKNK